MLFRSSWSPFLSLGVQVTVNWFQMQQAQAAVLPAHYLALSESAKSYEPGQRYAQFVRNLPREPLHLEALSSDSLRSAYCPNTPTYSKYRDIPPEASRVKCLAQGHNIILHGGESNRQPSDSYPDSLSAQPHPPCQIGRAHV